MIHQIETPGLLQRTRVSWAQTANIQITSSRMKYSFSVIKITDSSMGAINFQFNVGRKNWLLLTHQDLRRQI